MRVGLAQLGATSDVAANQTQAMEMAAAAARQGVDLLVFPEVLMYWRPANPVQPLGEIAESVGGPFMQAIAGAARQHRLLALGGAEVIVMPTSWVSGPLKEDHWVTLVRARAIENVCWFVAASQIRPDRIGRSLVIDPMGVVVADGGEEQGLVVAEVDLDRLRRVREKNPSLQHRRPELYGAVA